MREKGPPYMYICTYYIADAVGTLKSNTLIMFYKRRPIRDGRQIVEKNKRQGLPSSKKLRDSAHWGPEAVAAEFALEAI